MIGSRILVALVAALIGAVVGLLIGLWGVSEEEDALALALTFLWGPVIGGLLGLAVGWVAAVVWWARAPKR